MTGSNPPLITKLTFPDGREFVTFDSGLQLSRFPGQVDWRRVMAAPGPHPLATIQQWPEPHNEEV